MSLESLLSSALPSLATDPAILSYIASILLDPDTPATENIETAVVMISQFVNDSDTECDVDVDLEVVVRDVVDAYYRLNINNDDDTNNADADADGLSGMSEMNREVEDEMRRVRELEKEALRVDAKREGRKTLSKDDRAVREKVLGLYGYDVDEIVETDGGEVEIRYKGRAQTRTSALDGIEGNRNALRVKEEEQVRRMQAKKEHEKKVERDKQLLEQQRLEKEKEKQRTQKQEKRRM